MDTVEIRAPRQEEFPEIIGLSGVAFGEETPAEDEAVYRRTFPFDRALCAFEAGTMVAVSACAPTTRSPDLTLRLESLGAVYLGGVSFAMLLRAGLVQESTAGAARRADAMFLTGVAPHCSTMF